MANPNVYQGAPGSAPPPVQICQTSKGSLSSSSAPVLAPRRRHTDGWVAGRKVRSDGWIFASVELREDVQELGARGSAGDGRDGRKSVNAMDARLREARGLQPSSSSHDDQESDGDDLFDPQLLTSAPSRDAMCGSTMEGAAAVARGF